MNRVVACANPAGSTAKSTVTAALAHLAHSDGRRVLVIDLDPQANLTDWVSGSRDAAGISGALQAVAANDPTAWPGVPTEEVLADRRRHVQRTIQQVPLGFDLISADYQLRSTIKRFQDLRVDHPEQLIAEAVHTVESVYDVVLLDCKGDLGVLSEAALRASTEVIGIAAPTTKALQGLQLLRAEVDKLAGSVFRTVVPVRVLPRNRGADADDLLGLMRAEYGEWVTPPVRGAANLDAAYTAGLPITAYDPKSGVAEDLRDVYRELRDRGVMP